MVSPDAQDKLPQRDGREPSSYDATSGSVYRQKLNRSRASKVLPLLASDRSLLEHFEVKVIGLRELHAKPRVRGAGESIDNVVARSRPIASRSECGFSA